VRPKWTINNKEVKKKNDGYKKSTIKTTESTKAVLWLPALYGAADL